MELSFPKKFADNEPCQFVLEDLYKNQVPDYKIVIEYLHGRLDLIQFTDDVTKITDQMMDLAKRIVDAFAITSLQSIIELIQNEKMELSASDRVPLIYNFEDALFSELTLLQNGPLDYESIGNKLPGCKATNPQSVYKYGEVCSKLLALLDLVWIYKDGKTKVTLSPIGIVFKKCTIYQRCILFKKLIFRMEVIRNIFRSNSIDYQCITNEISKWVNDSTITRRYQSVNKLIKEINEKCTW